MHAGFGVHAGRVQQGLQAGSELDGVHLRQLLRRQGRVDSCEQRTCDLAARLLIELHPPFQQLVDQIRCTRIERTIRGCQASERGVVFLAVEDQQRASGDVAEAHVLLGEHRRRQPDQVSERQRIDQAKNIADQQRADAWNVAGARDDANAGHALARRTAAHEDFEDRVIEQINADRRPARPK